MSPGPAADTLRAARLVVLETLGATDGYDAARRALQTLSGGALLDVAAVLAMMAGHRDVILTAEEYELLMAGWTRRVDEIERGLGQ